MKTLKEIIGENEVAGNCVGGGKIAAVGIGSAGEPGVKKKPKAKKTLRGVISVVNLKGG